MDTQQQLQSNQNEPGANHSVQRKQRKAGRNVKQSRQSNREDNDDDHDLNDRIDIGEDENPYDGAAYAKKENINKSNEGKTRNPQSQLSFTQGNNPQETPIDLRNQPSTNQLVNENPDNQQHEQHNIQIDDDNQRRIQIAHKKIKKGLKKGNKNGIQMNDSSPINDNENDNIQQFKKGKNKKEREQQIIIDDHSLNDDNDDNNDNNNDGLFQKEANHGIEFYNRQQNLDYVEDHQREMQNEIDIHQESIDHSDDGNDDYKNKQPYQENFKNKMQKDKKLNQQYLEELKRKNEQENNGPVEENKDQPNLNNEQEEEEQDYYTQQYLKQSQLMKSQKQKQKSVFNTIQSDQQEGEAYGLKSVRVKEVEEPTRTARSKKQKSEYNQTQRDFEREDNFNNDKSFRSVVIHNQDGEVQDVEDDELQISQQEDDDEEDEKNSPQNQPFHRIKQVYYNKKGKEQHFEDIDITQQDNSYFQTNENKRILESHENQERNHQDDEQFHQNQGDDVYSKQLSVGSKRSQRIESEENQFERLHLNLRNAIKEANYEDHTIVPFKKEQFKTIILNTYDDWYSDRSAKWDIADFLEVVALSNLEKELGAFLEQNNSNLLTLSSMPFLDLGERPKTYTPTKTESEQIFITPSSELPHKIVIKYADCKPVYNIRTLNDKYQSSTLPDCGITFEDFQHSIIRASHYLLPYRGRVTKYDRISLSTILGGLIVTIALSMGLGISIHWAISLIFIILYFVFAAVSVKIIKRFQNKFLRQSHFMLAVYCRHENNRMYLKHRAEMRPGFLGKWIEIVIHEETEPKKLIEKFLERYELQKEMRQISLFNNKQGKQPQMNEQLQRDQQLALLMQQQEEQQAEHEEEKEEEDIENHNGAPMQDQIYSGLYKPQSNKMKEIQNEDQFFSSPDNNYSGAKGFSPDTSLMALRGGNKQPLAPLHAIQGLKKKYQQEPRGILKKAKSKFDDNEEEKEDYNELRSSNMSESITNPQQRMMNYDHDQEEDH